MVAALLSIMAAIAAPRYSSSLVEYRVDAAARRVQADIAAARAAARACSGSLTIQFVAGGYSINQLQAVDGPGTYQVSFVSEPYRLDGFAPDFAVDNYLRFDGYGVPQRGGTITLRAGSARRVVTVAPLTGETTVGR